MNILFFNDCLGVGGGEKWAMQCAQKLRGRGHNISIACPAGAWFQKQAIKLRMPYFTYLPEKCFVPHLIWSVREFVQEEKIDVIFCTLLGYRNEAEILTHALREAGRGTIILKMGLPPWRGLTSRHLGDGLEDCVKKIVVVAHSIKVSILEAMKRIPPDRIQVCYQGADLSIYDSNKHNQKVRARVRSELGIDVKNTVIATIARLELSKGHQYLLQTAARVLQEHSNVIFIIAGEGSEKAHIEQIAHSLGISDRIVFTGFVNDIAQLLSVVDFLVQPSLEEGLSNAVMEAMAMAKPIVATNVGGVSELIVQGETGLMVPPMDSERLTEAILQLLKDKNRMNAMGVAGRRRMETHFNMDVQVKVLENLLQKEVDEATNIKRQQHLIPLNQLDLSTEAPDFIFRKSWPRF